MFVILAILAAGLIAGRTFLALTGRRAGVAERLTGYVVWVMLAAFGLRIGSDAAIMTRLPSLGLAALILGTAATAASALLVRLLLGVPDCGDGQPLRQQCPGGSFSPRALTGSAVTLLFFGLGLAVGQGGWLPVDTATADRWATVSLYILIALVGLSTGSNPRLMTILRGVRPTVAAVPVLSVLATLAAGAAVGMLTPSGAADGAVAVSGMGYYSLSSMIISDLRAADLGSAAAMSLAAVALMANIVREVIALVAIPVIGPRIGQYASTAMCGVTSLDVTLPTLAATFGPRAVPGALVNGIILEIATPFLVLAACRLA